VYGDSWCKLFRSFQGDLYLKTNHWPKRLRSCHDRPPSDQEFFTSVQFGYQSGHREKKSVWFKVTERVGSEGVRAKCKRRKEMPRKHVLIWNTDESPTRDRSAQELLPADLNCEGKGEVESESRRNQTQKDDFETSEAVAPFVHERWITFLRFDFRVKVGDTGLVWSCILRMVAPQEVFSLKVAGILDDVNNIDIELNPLLSQRGATQSARRLSLHSGDQPLWNWLENEASKIRHRWSE
jgi:hypothetical protein